MKQSNPLIAWAYCRTSSPDHESSYESQRKEIQDYCHFRRVYLARVDKGVDPVQPEFLKSIPSEEYAIIVADLSSLANSVRDSLAVLERIREKGLKFICLHPEIDTSTPVGEKTLDTLLVLNQLERKPDSSLPSRKKPAFGYLISPTGLFEPDPDPDVERILKKIKQLANGTSHAAIASVLNDNHDYLFLMENKLRRMKYFNAQTIAEILDDLKLDSSTIK